MPALAWLWRSRVRYEWKAAGLAIGALLATPYLFLYDVMVLAIAIGFVIRVGLAEGFRRHELPMLGLAFVLIVSYQFLGAAPTGFGATLVVAAIVTARVTTERVSAVSASRAMAAA